MVPGKFDNDVDAAGPIFGRKTGFVRSKNSVSAVGFCPKTNHKNGFLALINLNLGPKMAPTVTTSLSYFPGIIFTC